MTEAEEKKEAPEAPEAREAPEAPEAPATAKAPEGLPTEAAALGFQEDTTADPSKATEAPVETDVAAVKPIYLAGRAFTNRTELQDHVKKIQDSKADVDPTKGDLTVEENLFIFHLLLHHPKAVEKMTKPISHFRYGTYDKFKNKCFISVAVDGTEEGVSASKSINVIFPGTSANGAAPAATSATAGLVALPPEEKKEKGQKRNREERPPPEPRVFEPHEMVRGCVVDIKGLPSNVNYGRLKELLNGCGKVRFLQFLNMPKKTREPPKKKAKTEEAEDAEEKGEVEVEKEEKEEKEEEEAEEEEEIPVTARCRFDDPEGASGALAALNGAEVQGATVEISLLEGDEEEAYWEESNRKRKEAFDNPKGKGKDGKGKKGKGKGKGKKGKNKSDD